MTDAPARLLRWLSNTCRQAAWAPLAVFAFFLAARSAHAYLTYPWLDMPTHFAGGMAMTWFYLAAAGHAQALLGGIPRLIRHLLALGLTALTAVMWEFFEYASDQLFGTLMNLGVADTLMDLFMGLAGALATLAIAVWRPPQA